MKVTMVKSKLGFYSTGDALPILARPEELHPALLDYLLERRRAIITELRKIEQMLDIEQSIPQRQRPH